MLETILPLIAGLIGGSFGKAGLDWARGKKQDTANVHKTDTDALLVSTGMVKQWLHAAGEAQVTIHNLRISSTEKDITILGVEAKLRDAQELIERLTESLKEHHDRLEKRRAGDK